MLTLLIDSCTERAIVSVDEDGHSLYFAGLPFGYHNSKLLVPKIEEALEAAGKTLNDLDFIVVGVGPGSYTGMRVGATVGKTLSYSSKIPLVGVSTLTGFVSDHSCRFAAIIDAKSAGAYYLLGERVDGVIVHDASGPQVASLDSLPEKLAGVEALVSPSCAPLQEKLKSVHDQVSWKWEETAPDPTHMIYFAKEKFDRGEYSVDGSLDLFYVR